ncbi:MAG: lipocalin family protein [Jatrophihabitans sp.]
MRLVRRLGMVAVVTAIALGLGSEATASAAPAPVTPVSSVQLDSYVGSWFQVASIPQIFEIQCARNVRATYTAEPDGTVGVVNTCRTYFGTTSRVSGRARVENAPANSVLTVSFVKLFGRQIYLGGPNYEIVGLDPQYNWAVVVSPDRGSAFVLSRTPALTGAQMTDIRGVLTGNGVSPCSLTVTRQDGGAAGGGRFC